MTGDTLLQQLREAVHASGNVSRLIRESGIDRRTLYRMMSGTGNPRLANIQRLASFLGLKISCSPYEPPKGADPLGGPAQAGPGGGPGPAGRTTLKRR